MFLVSRLNQEAILCDSCMFSLCQRWTLFLRILWFSPQSKDMRIRWIEATKFPLWVCVCECRAMDRPSIQGIYSPRRLERLQSFCDPTEDKQIWKMDGWFDFKVDLAFLIFVYFCVTSNSGTTLGHHLCKIYMSDIKVLKWNGSRLLYTTLHYSLGAYSNGMTPVHWGKNLSKQETRAEIRHQFLTPTSSLVVPSVVSNLTPSLSISNS